jgi:hypothetical protein
MAKKIEEPIVASKDREIDSPRGILVQEYNSLVSLYTHSENTLFSIFNFYVTLLTTITGVIIVVFQLGEKNISNPFSTVLVLLTFIVLIGLITQDALIHKNGDLTHFALALNLIKSYLLKSHPEMQSHVFYMWDLHARVNPLKYKISLDEKIDKYLWWMLPIGMHQWFVSLMNSLALAAILIALVYSFGKDQVNILSLVISIPLVIVFSFIAHCTYANIKFRHKVKRSSISMDGKLQEWIE